MASTFYWNPVSNKGIQDQWFEHIQRDNYVSEVGNLIEYNRKSLQNTISSVSAEEQKVMNSILGSLNRGFERITSQLYEVNNNLSALRGEISEMAYMLDWRLSQVVEEQRLTNAYLGHISQLLRIPDSQKQRVYHIEQGMKYLKNAIMEGIYSDFFKDSLMEFQKAKEIEPRDYITLNRIGYIHLYSAKFFDSIKAEEAFVASARESYAEHNIGGTNTNNSLSAQGYETKVVSVSRYLASTIESYLYAGRAAYLRKDFTNAITYADKAYKLAPNFYVSGIEKAKYLVKEGKSVEASELLKTIIKGDKNTLIRILQDSDLTLDRSIQSILESLRVESKLKAESILKHGEDIYKKKYEIVDLCINHVKRLLKEDNYLASEEALDFMSKNPRVKHNINFNSYDTYITKREGETLSDYISRLNSTTIEIIDSSQKQGVFIRFLSQFLMVKRVMLYYFY